MEKRKQMWEKMSQVTYQFISSLENATENIISSFAIFRIENSKLFLIQRTKSPLSVSKSIRKGFRTGEDHCKTYTTIFTKKVTQKVENKVKRFPNGYYVPWGCCESVYKMVESKPPLF